MFLLPRTKKKKNHPRDLRREECCSTCDIMLDDTRSTQGKVIRNCPRLLPCADRASSSMISHVEQRSSRPESRGWFFFFFIQGSRTVGKHAWPWAPELTRTVYIPIILLVMLFTVYLVAKAILPGDFRFFFVSSSVMQQ